VFRKLQRFYWPYRMTLLYAILSMVLLTAVGLVRPYIRKVFFDAVVIGGLYNQLPYLVGATIAVALIRGVLNYARQYWGEQFGQMSVYELRNALYTKLQYLSFVFYDNAKTGNLMQRLTGDVEAFRMFLSFGFIFLMDFFFMLTFGFIMMLFVSWRLTLASLVFMPFLALTTWRFDSLIRPAYTKIRRAMADLSTTVQENISGIRTVKSYAREPHEIGKFSERNVGYLHRYLSASDLWARFLPIMELIGNLVTVLLLWYGGSMVIDGQLTLGDLVAFFSLIGYLIWPIRELGWLVNMYERAVAGGERLLEVLNAPVEITDRPGARSLERVRGHVEFRDVCFEYLEYDAEDTEDSIAQTLTGRPKSIRALHHIDIDAPPGSTIALLGATGSGKSTIVQLIPRFYEANSGQILLDGVDIRDISIDFLRRQVGMVMQETFLFSASVRENICYGRRGASMEEVIECARLAQAHEFIMDLPDGYDTVVGERGLGLSGGQKQRVAIARAFLIDPRILILDDATSSVDMETEHEIQLAVRTLMGTRTTFVIAHRLSSLKDADEILVLDEGRIVERGRHKQLLRRDGIYRQVYEVQFRDHEELARRHGQLVERRRANE